LKFNSENTKILLNLIKLLCISSSLFNKSLDSLNNFKTLNMKVFKNLVKTAFFLTLIGITLISCSNDDEMPTPPVVPEPSNTIADFVSNNEDYSILLEALQAADGNLDVVLSGDGPFTVFAPNNAAFAAFLSANNFNALSDIPTDVLSQVLLNHVVSGNAVSSSLTTGYDVSSLSTATPNGNNLSLYINTADGVVINGVSKVTAADVSVDNGTIHAVDAVIGLPTVVTFAAADPNFTILVTALTRADLTFDYVGTLSTANGTAPAPFTVFAPIDQAFIDLLEELGVSSLEDIDEPTLNATLKMHAVAGANVLAASLSDGLKISTLGGDITANVTDGATLTDGNNRVSNIIAVNVQASNGVIHAINKVLLPSEPTNTIADFVSNNEDYSILLEALQTADGDLDVVLSGDGPFTVFAPNNAAFTAFLSDNNFDALSDVPTDLLSQILLNHVVSGNAVSSTLTTGYDVSSLSTATPNGNKMSLYINTADGVVINGVSTVTAADVSVDNGTIHAVDAVIGLPTVVTFAVADPNFSILVTALTRPDLTFDFVGALSTANGTDPAPFTVFAPTDKAFVDLLEELNVDSLDDIDEPTLTATLKMHAVAGANVLAASLSDGLTISTLGGDITANVTDDGATLTDANDRVSKIIAVDVQASNGVIHAINKVLLK
jgi:transforming growth factor-beta-induced protein